MRKFFLGMAAHYTPKEILAHTFAIGKKADCEKLKTYLEKHYHGETLLCKNGRSGLSLALRAYFEKGDGVIVNGFTCYAVYEAIIDAGMVPVWVDIEKQDLNFSVQTILSGMKTAESSRTKVRGIIVQNTLGNPVNMAELEGLAKKHNLLIIEDLAHCAGIKYPDGREAGTVGAATVLSFGKDKSIDTISGGAVIFRDPCKNRIQAPSKVPQLADHLRARFYPMWGALCRMLTHIHLGGALMRLLVKLHWVEKSADNKLDLTRKISKFEAKMALTQLKQMKKSGEPPLREFCLVQRREKALKELMKSGYYFSGFWYEKPVSPKRYYRKTKFPEKNCPNSVFIAEHIINIPTHYQKSELAPAREIIKKYLLGEVEHE